MRGPDRDDSAAGLRDTLIELLAHLPAMDNPADRRLLITLIRDNVADFPEIPDNAKTRLHVIEIVRACLERPERLWALSEAVGTMAPGEQIAEGIQRLLERATMLDLLLPGAVRAVHEMLASATGLDVNVLWYRAAGDLAPVPDGALPSLSAAFDHLATVNADPEGLPPALALVEYVSWEVDGLPAERLRGWADAEALRIGVSDQLRALRAARPEVEAAAAPPAALPCLVVQLEKDGISGRYLLSHWVQHRPGRWQPERGEDQTLALADFSSVVDTLVDRAEAMWTAHRGPVSVEFVLPIELLNHELEWSPKHVQTEHPIPLCLQYQVVLRSLERMRAQAWHRLWHNRWEAMMADGQQMRLHPSFVDRDDSDLDRWNYDLVSDEGLASVALSTPPDRNTGKEELAMALRAGVPVMFWDRRNSRTDALVAAVSVLVNGAPADLPERTKALRYAAASQRNGNPDSHVGRYLAVLWDDPTRLIDAGGVRS